jgi:hypothetical protein
MKNRHFGHMIDSHLNPKDPDSHHDAEAGYLWFFLAAGLIICFMVLSHCGIAS